ncbi:MAG: ATP-binding cassette domain-containing protein [Vulcanimicrobiota bacterium]
MISVQNITKVFNSQDGEPVKAVDNVSFEVSEGQTLCLIGTSGSGKTTCLKMINRLVEPTSGDIWINGTDVIHACPIELRRGLGYVIQKAGLLPHLTVAQNVGLLPRILHWENERKRARVDELLDLVSLSPDQYRDRYPRELSGGQQQRVGVARALVLDPPIILMDEPFGALDPITREGLHDEFLRLKEEVGKTVVMVTHDLAEAFKLGDCIALMDGGKLVQFGSEDDFRERPENDFVQDFVRSHVESR